MSFYSPEDDLISALEPITGLRVVDEIMFEDVAIGDAVAIVGFDKGDKTSSAGNGKAVAVNQVWYVDLIVRNRNKKQLREQIGALVNTVITTVSGRKSTTAQRSFEFLGIGPREVPDAGVAAQRLRFETKIIVNGV